MQCNGWINFGITTVLFLAFIAIIVYYYNPKRKTKVEEPKYKMLEDDDDVIDKKGSMRDENK